MRNRSTGNAGPRVHERDERWVIVALVVLAAAYVVYWFVRSGGVDLPGVRLRGFDLSGLRKVGSVLPYLATVFIGILTQVVKRARSARAQREMDRRASREGVLVKEPKASWWEVSDEGKRGKVRSGRIMLSRAALYLVDAKSGEPTRFPFLADEPGARTVTGATTRRGDRGIVVELVMIGSDGGRLRLSVPDPSKWVVALARASGRRPTVAEGIPEEEETDQDKSPESSDAMSSILNLLGS